MDRMNEPLTPLQQTELHALTGDRLAIIRLVSAVRKYRAIAVEFEAESDAEGRAFFATYGERIQDIEGEGNPDWWK